MAVQAPGSERVEPFVMRIAGLVVRVRPVHGLIRRLCRDYLLAPDDPAAQAPDLDASASAADIALERSLSDVTSPAQPASSDAYLETLAVYRKVAEWAPLVGVLLMHGAVIEYGGRAHLFTAPSGTGKSTHIRLWAEFLGDAVQVVNGDKPLVRVGEGGAPATVYGTPWCGKEGWQRNVSAPLASICFIERAPRPGANSVRALAPTEALDRVMRQVYLPQTPEAAARTLELVDALLAKASLYLLTADMSEDAVRTSFEALTGQGYEEARRRRG